MRLTGNSGGTDAGTLAYLADGLGSVQAAAGNMVTGGPVAATSVTPTNSYNEAAYPSAKTIDGDTTGSSGFWAGTANTTTPSMLTLELGSSQTVSRVKLHRVASYLADYTVKAADVQLRQADNSWLTVGTLSGNTTVDSPEIAFPAAAGSAVRVIFKGARVGTLVLVAEVTLQLDSGSSSLATQRFDAWGGKGGKGSGKGDGRKGDAGGKGDGARYREMRNWAPSPVLLGNHGLPVRRRAAAQRNQKRLRHRQPHRRPPRQNSCRLDRI